MFIKEFEEYSSLISNADGYFEIQNGSTYDKEHNIGQNFTIENSSYNDYLMSGLSRYQAKLKSLSILIEQDIAYIQKLKTDEIAVDDSLLNKIDELHSLFFVDKTFIQHRNFTLSISSNSNTHKIGQEYYIPFIRVAFESIQYLRQFGTIEKAFQKLFIGDKSIVSRNMSFVEKAFTDLGILTHQKTPTLTARGKSTLWCLIHTLRDSKIIDYSLDGDCMSVFWKYLKAESNAPKHPHKETEKYLNQKKRVERYFQDYYK